MAIDLQSELARKRAMVDSYGNPATSGLNVEAARNSVNSRRNAFFSGTVAPQVASYGQNMGGAQQGAENIAKRNLVSESERSFAQRLRAEDISRLDKIFQNATRRAEQSGLSVQQTNEYARQQVMDEIQRQFAAEEAQKNRGSTERINEIQNQLTDKDEQLQNKLQNDQLDSEYQQAMNRALFGIGTSLATFGGIKAYQSYKNQPTQPSTFDYSRNYNAGGVKPYSESYGHAGNIVAPNYKRNYSYDIQDKG